MQMPFCAPRLMRLMRLALPLAAALGLTACGGGSGGEGFHLPVSPGGTSVATTDQPGMVTTDADPATPGSPSTTVTPPGAAPDPRTDARRPETVRCAP